MKWPRGLVKATAEGSPAHKAKNQDSGQRERTCFYLITNTKIGKDWKTSLQQNWVMGSENHLAKKHDKDDKETHYSITQLL